MQVGLKNINYKLLKFTNLRMYCKRDFFLITCCVKHYNNFTN